MQESTTKTAPNAEVDVQEKLNRQALRKERLTVALSYAGLVLLVVLFTAMTGGKFLSGSNLQLLLNQSFTMIIIIVGATFLYACGSFDMAIGQTMALSSLVLTELLIHGVPLLFSLIAGIITAVFAMCVTATAKNYLKLSPFIASMCVANVGSGIVSAVSKQGKVVFPYSQVSWVDTAPVKLIVLVIVVIIGMILFNYTALGKSARFLGGNPTVARISGIKIEKINYLIYIFMGILIGIAALFTVARAGVVDPTIGSATNLNVMVAIVLGGFPLSGGANAKYAAPIVGSLTVTVLTNGLGMIGQASAVGYLIKGILFIIVIAVSYEKSKGKLVE